MPLGEPLGTNGLQPPLTPVGARPVPGLHSPRASVTANLGACCETVRLI